MRPIVLRLSVLALASVLSVALAHAASLEDLVSAVVRIKTTINPDGQTVQALGREREGSGIVIDEDGLVLTIGYLMVEAHAAEITTNAGRTVRRPSSVTITRPASAFCARSSRSR